MTMTDATTQASPSWWSQKMGSGEADPTGGNTGGTDESLGFADFLDVINPLQHIPVVSTIYRELTGDQISETARMAGGAVWGGPAGLIGALANTITQRETGGDIGATALAMARGEEITGSGQQDPASLIAAAPQDAESTAADLASSPVPEAVATLAAAHQTMAAPAQTQTFSGTAASRLDAFIQSANAVRTPANAPISASGTTVPMRGQIAAAPLRQPPVTDRPTRIAPEQTDRTPPTPLKLAADGNTDVAHWMSRALDRYETMKAREQS